MSTAPLLTSQKKIDYATADDIQHHFVATMNDLFCLALLLTSNADKAEDCIIRSIRECLEEQKHSQGKAPGLGPGYCCPTWDKDREGYRGPFIW